MAQNKALPSPHLDTDPMRAIRIKRKIVYLCSCTEGAGFIKTGDMRKHGHFQPSW